MSDPIFTTLSSKGQVVLPSSIRASHRWAAGTRLVVEATDDGVLLRPAAGFEPTRVEDVFGMLAYDGPSKSLEDMDAGVLQEARRLHEGD